jgi:DNA-binding transcriptional LysR family regulator
VGASTTVATYFLPPCLGEFARAHPGVALQLVSANTRAIARAVVERRIDVALVEGPVQDERITTRRWREDELIVIAPPAHALARKRSVHAADLAAYAFIVREPGSGTRVVASRALAQAGVHVPVAMQLGSTEAIKQAVAANLGISVASRYSVQSELDSGRLCMANVPALRMNRRLLLLHHKDKRLSKTAVAFRLLLQELSIRQAVRAGLGREAGASTPGR